ncbi:tRNA (adenine22-N1)-methyltransferase [Salinibacillus kushneri]|uniref:tRNA (Adenine22-N1)-methyltransferase n=1 Tax=Salinibacillus kushneri TaxID=237682 RepID=A0A1I0FXY4_9BACI|nr:tRNA (adenine(22)-N(1))-methyltransferase TrmK [Salinibacillus kushneri]SET63411.1 tRNA (adenine22-N1)-methyltransferase [Salinibacillus kushneri]
MADIQLSKRLKSITYYLPERALFADIGSDHAYLPCYVCLNDSEASAIAGEINKGPYLRAYEQVQKWNLLERIGVRQGDGLSVIEPNEVEQVVIAGMGGTLITNILENGKEKLAGVKRIIVQPNINARYVRKWLNKHSFSLSREQVIEEDGRYYEIIVADYNPSQPLMEYTEKEYYLGPINGKEKSQAFIQKWSGILQKNERIIKEMKKASQPDEQKIAEFEQQMDWIKEALKDE